MNAETRKRVGLLVLVIAASALYFTLSPHWPKDQVIHFVLGASAPRVTELRVGYAPHSTGKRDEDWTREATFRFPEGNAPRVVTHEPRLADGDYDVEIELQTPTQRATVERRVTLQSGATSIDLSESVPR